MHGKIKQSAEMPLFEHLKELRKVLLFSAYAIALGTITGWVLSDEVYHFLAQPLSGLRDVHFITITPMEPVFVKLQVSVVFGVLVALPIVMWQIWSFILPALNKNEKKYLYLTVPWSIILFIGGAAFCYYFVLPVGLKFLLFAGGGAVESTPFVTKSSYLSFIITFLLCFGVVFQLPIVLLLLIRLGYLSPKTLAKHRKWAFFIIVILAVIISPTPDLLTQLLMAGPMYLLYEISIWLGYLVVRNKRKKQAKLNQNREVG
ncbi:MAG: Sec-independent protein translocase protein TatC [Candidatus Dichloromethanomonas elyunquensis]|nr:MAG: Sec-independent protein translocase protein TatC [Candidatus Dichloromethanomonas elyunquensis]